MAIAHEPSTTERKPFLPPITADELARRNAEAIRLLDSWETEGDEQDHRETMDVLREALGEGRTMGYRRQFP